MGEGKRIDTIVNIRLTAQVGVHALAQPSPTPRLMVLKLDY